MTGAPLDAQLAPYPATLAPLTWTEQQILTTSDAAAGDAFGKSTALDANTALIGALGDGDAGAFSGAAYIFSRNAGAWAEQQKLRASGGAADDRFGSG